MLIGMLFNAIPRSFRAGVALLVTFICLPAGFQALGMILASEQRSAWLILRCIGGLVTGAIAGVVFYYLQIKDASPETYHSLETMHAYYKDRSELKKQEPAGISPAYPPEKPTKQL